MHEIERHLVTQNEISARNALQIKGKYFVPPPPPSNDARDFKELFAYLASVGAGRLVEKKSGVPNGPWTPELLARAICEVNNDATSIDIRTVQHWFQSDDKGISPSNIHLLARIFGCDDPDAIVSWQAALTASKRRLVAKRRRYREAPVSGSESGQRAAVAEPVPAPTNASTPQWRGARTSLAMKTFDLFGGKMSKSIPILVFAGATALGLTAFSLGIASVQFTAHSGVSKEVGFLWAPNWTFSCLALLPLYIASVSSTLNVWRSSDHARLSDPEAPALSDAHWDNELTPYSPIFWAIFFLTFVVASGVNWTSAYLMPLLHGAHGKLPIDWGRVAIVRPDVISAESGIAFSAVSFIYNAACTYLFFSGLVLCHILVGFYRLRADEVSGGSQPRGKWEVWAQGLELYDQAFKIAFLGLLITIAIKLQACYLISASENILSWLIDDFTAVVSFNHLYPTEVTKDNAPGIYFGFFSTIPVLAMFMIATTRIRWACRSTGLWESRSSLHVLWALKDGTIGLLALCYVLAGSVHGFTVVLLIATAVASALILIPLRNHEQPSLREHG